MQREPNKWLLKVNWSTNLIYSQYILHHQYIARVPDFELNTYFIALAKLMIK